MLNVALTNPHKKYQPKLAFGRALSEKELSVYQQTINKAKKLTDINNTTLILPDFYAPEGTITSDESLKFINLMQRMNGINSVQSLPRTRHYKPFSGSAFEMEEDLIYYKNLETSDLTKAYDNFCKLPENNALKQEFKIFTEQNPHCERYGMLDALAKKYGTDYWPHWHGKKAELDKYLFDYDDAKEIPVEKKLRQEEIRKKYHDEINFYKYKQFILNKQHREMKGKLNKNGIKSFGDVPYGFNHRDEWAFKYAFEEGKIVGYWDRGNFKSWGFRCLDYNKLYNQDGSLGAAGRVFKKKIDVYLANYDGLRFDVGWGLVNPVTKKTNEIARQESLDNKLLNIIDMSINEQKKNGKNIKPEEIMLEMVGAPRESINLTKNKYSHIHLTRYANDVYGTNKYYLEEGYNPDKYTIGIGCHDDPSVIDIEKGIIEFHDENNPNILKRQTQAESLSKDLKTRVKNSEEFRNAKFAEIFCARNQFFTATDAIGDSRRLNNPNNQFESWKIKIPSNYEEFYFKNLSEGKGLNLPVSLATAIRAKIGENAQTREILSSLDNFGKILKETGPYTIAEATKLFDKKSDASPSSKLEKTLNELKGNKKWMAITGIVALAFAAAGIYFFQEPKKTKEEYHDDTPQPENNNVCDSPSIARQENLFSLRSRLQQQSQD